MYLNFLIKVFTNEEDLGLFLNLLLSIKEATVFFGVSVDFLYLNKRDVSFLEFIDSWTLICILTKYEIGRTSPVVLK